MPDGKDGLQNRQVKKKRKSLEILFLSKSTVSGWIPSQPVGLPRTESTAVNSFTVSVYPIWFEGIFPVTSSVCLVWRIVRWWDEGEGPCQMRNKSLEKYFYNMTSKEKKKKTFLMGYTFWEKGVPLFKVLVHHCNFLAAIKTNKFGKIWQLNLFFLFRFCMVWLQTADILEEK